MPPPVASSKLLERGLLERGQTLPFAPYYPSGFTLLAAKGKV
jgi:hypothetical protein